MKSKALLAVAALALAGAAQADTVTYSFTNPLQTTEINQTGSLSLFDSSMGMLTGVSLSFTGSNQTAGMLTNHASQAHTVTATSNTDLYFNSTLAALDALIQSANPVLRLEATSSAVNLGVGQSADFGPLSDSDSLTWSGELNDILASFTQAGGGLFNLGCTSDSFITVRGGGGNVNSEQNTQAQCGASITYTFADLPPSNVPEPAMPALIGISLLGLWAVRRRKA